MTVSTARQSLLPAGLIGLSLVPVVAGGVRVGQLTTGAAVTPDNARFFASPLPVVVHIVGATVFCLLGAFQFVPRIRQRHPRYHRLAGRLLLVPAGLAAALSGLWMSAFYPRPADVGDAVTAIRLLFGSAMVASLVLAVRAIRQGRVGAHRAWMARGYAIGLAAGTQAFTQLPWMVLVGPLDATSKAPLMLAGWLINLAVAEWAIRRRPVSG